MNFCSEKKGTIVQPKIDKKDKQSSPFTNTVRLLVTTFTVQTCRSFLHLLFVCCSSVIYHICRLNKMGIAHSTNFTSARRLTYCKLTFSIPEKKNENGTVF